MAVKPVEVEANEATWRVVLPELTLKVPIVPNATEFPARSVTGEPSRVIAYVPLSGAVQAPPGAEIWKVRVNDCASPCESTVPMGVVLTRVAVIGPPTEAGGTTCTTTPARLEAATATLSLNVTVNW